VFVDAAGSGQVQVAAQEQRPAEHGRDLCRRDRLLCHDRRDRMRSQSTRRTACHDAHDVVGVSAVGQDPRPPLRVEDGRQATNALGSVAATHRVKAHLDSFALVPLARGRGLRHRR